MHPILRGLSITRYFFQELIWEGVSSTTIRFADGYDFQSMAGRYLIVKEHFWRLSLFDLPRENRVFHYRPNCFIVSLISYIIY